DDPLGPPVAGQAPPAAAPRASSSRTLPAVRPRALAAPMGFTLPSSRPGHGDGGAVRGGPASPPGAGPGRRGSRGSAMARPADAGTKRQHRTVWTGRVASMRDPRGGAAVAGHGGRPRGSEAEPLGPRGWPGLVRGKGGDVMPGPAQGPRREHAAPGQ